MRCESDQAPFHICSVDIARLAQRTHAAVVDDIELLFENLELSDADYKGYEGTYRTESGKRCRCFYLDREMLLHLISDYPPSASQALVDYLRELDKAWERSQPRRRRRRI